MGTGFGCRSTAPSTCLRKVCMNATMWMVAGAMLLVACGQGLGQTGAGAASTPDPSVRRLELGVGLADIRTYCIGSRRCALPSFGLGVSGAVNLTSHYAIDVDARDTPATSKGTTNEYGGHIAEVLVGVRGEIRAKHYGYFVRAQPGFFRWSRVITADTFTPPDQFRFSYGSLTRFVTSIGTGFEYAPTARIHFRGEVADLITPYSTSHWTNDFQPTVGMFVGVGRPLAWMPPTYDARTAHRFFDRANALLITTSVLGITADSVTTQNFIRAGVTEGDPVARPFAKYGWPGQISSELLETSVEVAVMYSLHRMHHHCAERAVPLAVAGIHAEFAYHNTTVSTSSK